MTVASAGLGGAWGRPSFEPSLTAASVGSGTTQQEIRGAPRPDSACLRDLRQAICMGKSLEIVWVGWKGGWRGVRWGVRASPGQGKHW